MKKLYSVETNAMRLYYVEHWDNDPAICVDWDLSEDEEKELIAAFETGKLDETANGGEWKPIEEAYDGTFHKNALA